MRCFIGLFLILFIPLSGFSQPVAKTNNDSVITWSRSHKLEWTDFQGNLDPNVFAYAVTSYKIDIIPDDIIVDSNENIINYKELNVLTNFYKNHSWSVSSDKELLDHERLHFDIAELFARKIRKKFDELKKAQQKNYNEYWKEYTLLWKECRAYQKLYDSETNHGANSATNYEWQLKITKLLDK